MPHTSLPQSSSSTKVCSKVVLHFYMDQVVKGNGFTFQVVDANKVKFAMELAVMKKRAEKAEAKVVSTLHPA